MRPLAVYPVLFILVLADTAGCHKPQRAPIATLTDGGSPWTVVAVREPTPDDVPFEKASQYLWPTTTTDPNDVPGPDSLRAFVRTNEESRPQVYLEDLKSGTTKLLFPGYAFAPRWSPDGRYIACTEWKSIERYRDLTIVELPTGRVFAGPVAAGASEKKWSPDGGTLLVSGIKYSVGHAVLYALTIPDLTAHTLDSTTVVASYYYSWSPDACWVAYTRPTAVHPIAGDTIAADVWIASPATGEQWRLLETPEWIDSEPLWITNRSILIERTYWNGMNFGIVEHKVLDLDFAQQSRASP